MHQDFSGQNLRGHSFKGQHLAGANFSYADIQGADFTGANLRDAKFIGAKAGLQHQWGSILLIASQLMTEILNFFSEYTSYLASFNFYNSNSENFFAASICLILLSVFWVITIQKGIILGLGSFAFAAIIAFASAKVLAKTKAGARAVTGGLAFAFAFATVGALVFNLARAGIFGFIILLFGSYIGWRVFKADEKDALIDLFSISFTAKGGTSFRDADLTDADFTKATLKSTDLRNAILTRTCFRQAEMLYCIYSEESYLQNTEICRLLVTGQGQAKNFDRQNLRGVNLKGANLIDTSFIGADLDKANLQDADLSRAKLVQTQLDGTDFTGATLTGAFIEDWGITSDTKFERVKCEYVYMPERKPDNRQEEFADGEFADFIKPIFDILDLYHNQGVDSRAIAISFKQLAENHPDAELEIVAMEKRGQDKFLLRAKITNPADKSELSAEYFTIYNQLKALPKQEVQALMAKKDSRVFDLHKMIVTALQHPSFYSKVEQIGSMNNK
jgi:uncharacterized protein YjbI with pentapeptide repeats